MEATTTTDEKKSDWNGAAEASAEATAQNPEIIEAGTAKRKLPCLLSDDEKLALAGTLAQVHEDIDEEEEEAKASAAKHRDRLKDLYASASEKAGVFRAGKEDRLVDCRIIHDLTVGQCRVIRLDTNEITDERALSFAERQGKLDLGADVSLDGDEPLDESSDGYSDDDVDADIAALVADGTLVDNPAALAGDEPAPAKKSRKARKAPRFT